MALSVSKSLKVLAEIKRINSIDDYESRIDALIFSKDKVRAEVNDELDELYQSVELTKNGKLSTDSTEVTNTITAMSVCFSKEDQDAYDYEEMFIYMEKAMSELYWYERKMVELYLRLGTYRAIEKETKIPWESAYATIQGAFKKISEGAAGAGIDVKVKKRTKKKS